MIAQAGGTADRVTVGADADTETGDAKANAASTVVAGIQDSQDGGDNTANQLSVGDNGTIKGTAFTGFDATTDTTSGIADADVSVGSTGSGDAGVFGVQVDEIVVGNGGVVQGQAGSLIDVSANTVQGIGTNAGTANADALLNNSVLSAEELIVGNDALLEGNYGVLGRVDADLVVGASSVGSGTADSAMADGQVNLVKGLELGNGTTSAETALSIGNNATVAGVADVTNAATATSVDGNTEAVAKVGADGGLSNGEGASGIYLVDAMEVGQDATILANALVDLDATATTQAGVGSGSGTTKQVPALNRWSALISCRAGRKAQHRRRWLDHGPGQAERRCHCHQRGSGSHRRGGWPELWIHWPDQQFRPSCGRHGRQPFAGNR